MTRLEVPGPLRAAIFEHARREFPRECVGLLFGRGRRVTRRVALPNAAAKPDTAFYAEPDALFRALQGAEASGEAHLAVYHSHPTGPETPSPTDLRHAYFGVAHLIVVPHPASLRAFEIENERYRELDLVFDEPRPGPAQPQGESP